VFLGRLSKGKSTLARGKSMEITLYSHRIDEKMPVGASQEEKAIGMSDQAAAGAALIRFGSIPPCSVSRVMIHERTSWLKVHGARCTACWSELSEQDAASVLHHAHDIKT
jgi:hypothetical protein